MGRRGCTAETQVSLRGREVWHAGAPVVGCRFKRQDEGRFHPLPGSMTESKSTTGARIAPAGLMFLAVTSVGWGFNWPVTKYLLSELPPLTLRGTTGMIGAMLLAGLALASSQSLKVERHLWPRLMLASLLNVTGWMVLMGLALLWLPASRRR